MGSEKVFTTALSPESEGIPSGTILNFLQRIDPERICMHGFLLVRHNTMGWSSPLLWYSRNPANYAQRWLRRKFRILSVYCK